MKGEESTVKKRRELERKVLEKVGDTISSVTEANHVDQVIVALCSLSVRLFPLHPHSLAGCVDEKYQDELCAIEVPSGNEKTEWWNIFYQGSAFRAFARVLLHDIATNWLACFPTSVRKNVYDVFFVNGCATEIVQVLVPCLQLAERDHHNSSVVCRNAERLLVLCLLENDLVLQMAREFSGGCQFENLNHAQLKLAISEVSQLITSIPDKARRGAPTLLSAHLLYKRLANQLLRAAEEWDLKLLDEPSVSSDIHMNGTVLFVGEAFARICRRGSADVLLSEMIPQILGLVRSLLSSTSDMAISEVIESKPGFRFWLKIMEAVNDSHSVERIAEELLRQLSVQNVNDTEGYWILWILFSQVYQCKTSIRSIFVEKFLLWKVFPTCCLRWIIHFSVLECAPDSASLKSYNARGLSDTVHRLMLSWSRKEFVQSYPTEQQAYVTAALGLCLEKMTKEDLDTIKDGLPSILQGITCRLESPVYLIRKMASSIAFVFSMIIDPKNPLYLDDSYQEETIDWEFGLANPKKGSLTTTHGDSEKTDEIESSSTTVSAKEIQKKEDSGVGNTSKARMKKVFKLIDPDEVIDPASLVNESTFDEDESDNASEDSETSSDSSLQPYDLTDDDTDLKRMFSQLVDVVGALRKSDDVEGVEKALDVAEKLIRASPDELKFIAGDLAKTLVQVRCAEFSVEGEEESAEEKRQKSLVALIVTQPLESLDSLNKLLYSPNVDVSQRMMILDVMIDAAQELASTRILKTEHRQTMPLISTTTSDQPWFMPRNVGPPGAGSWKEISSPGTPLNWSYSYERKLPSKAGKITRGKTRRWGVRSKTQDNLTESSQNCFPQYAAAFMLPAMQGFDKKRHGVDLLGRDFIVLGKLIYMLGVCMKCAAMHPEASVLASPLLDMLRSREISHHAEAYVRRSVLFTASCVLSALHSSYVASALIEGNVEISEGLDWVRSWALRVAEVDTDRECHTLAMACLHLHAEMALQASRAMESSQNTSTAKGISLFPNVSNRSIKIPYLNS